MRNYFPVFLFLFIAVLQGKTQTFVAHDVLVSSMNAKICDIEIDTYKKRICWQSADDNKLWVCRLDTITWGLTVPDGKETLIDSTLTPIAWTTNSGEWGYDLLGTYIVYNKKVGRDQYIAVAAETGLTWSSYVMTDAPFRMNPHATRNPNDSTVAIHYISTIFTNYTKYKFLNNPNQEFWIHKFLDAHWADGEQLLTGINKNSHQVELFDPVNPGIPIQLTFDYGKVYSKPYMWRAPEHQNSRLFFANANGEEIRVFKEIAPNSNNYAFYMAFTSPSSNPLYSKIGSPEPCIYDGHSYITFMASSSECEASCFPGEIWIAKIDSVAPFFRMVSDTTIAIRSDPESFATNDSLLVYYTEVSDTSLCSTYYRLKKCDTGIGIGPVTGNHETVDKDQAKRIVYPNPFYNHVALKNAQGNELYNLTDKVGRTIWKGKQLEQEDFSDLQVGSYFLKTWSGNSIQTFGLIKK